MPVCSGDNSVAHALPRGGQPCAYQSPLSPCLPQRRQPMPNVRLAHFRPPLMPAPYADLRLVVTHQQWEPNPARLVTSGILAAGAFEPARAWIANANPAAPSSVIPEAAAIDRAPGITLKPARVTRLSGSHIRGRLRLHARRARRRSTPSPACGRGLG